ncbi:MAG: DUF11 domain-containing protein [Acidobacteriota bacterium]
MMKRFFVLAMLFFVLGLFSFGEDKVYFGVSQYDLLINKNFSKKYVEDFFRENAYRGANWVRIYSFFYGPYKYGDLIFSGFPNTYLPWKVVREESNNRKIFDLTQFSQEYEERLKWFFETAKYYGITVDICIFDTLAYRFEWDYHPFNPANNIQGFDGNYGGLPWNPYRVERTYFELYIKWLAEKLNPYDNIIIDLVNEGYPDSTKDMNVYGDFLKWEYNLVKKLFPNKIATLTTEAPLLYYIYCDVHEPHFIWGRSALYERTHRGELIIEYLESIPRPKILSSDNDGDPIPVWNVITSRNEGEISGLFQEAFKRNWGVDLTTLDYEKSFWTMEMGSEVYKSIFGKYPENWMVERRPNFSNVKYNYQEVDRITVRPGQPLTFTIDYKNTGGNGTGVTIINVVDSNLENIQPQNGGTLSGNKITWNIGNVDSNSGGRVSFTARVKANTPYGTKIFNSATINADHADPFNIKRIVITIIF